METGQQVDNQHASKLTIENKEEGLTTGKCTYMEVGWEEKTQREATQNDVMWSH